MSPQQGAATKTTALLDRNFLFHRSRNDFLYAAFNDLMFLFQLLHFTMAMEM